MKSKTRVVAIVASSIGFAALAIVFATSRFNAARRGSDGIASRGTTHGAAKVRRIPPVEVLQQNLVDEGLSARPAARWGDIGGGYDPHDPNDLAAAFLARAVQMPPGADDELAELDYEGLHVEGEPAAEEVADLDATLSFGFSEQDLEILSTETGAEEAGIEEEFVATAESEAYEPELGSDLEPWYAEIREPRRVSRRL